MAVDEGERGSVEFEREERVEELCATLARLSQTRRREQEQQLVPALGPERLAEEVTPRLFL